MSHFDWIHRESLRLGNMARDYHQQSVELLAEVLRLKADVDQLNAVVESHKDAGKRILAMLDEERRLTEHLKAEVERLKEGNDCLDKMHEKEMERSAWLREEFNRTTAWGRGLESDLSHARVEISFLKAEVERMSKDKPETIEATYVVSAEDAQRIRARLDRMTENNETSHPSDGK